MQVAYFETKERLLIGRKFLKTKSRPCFFSSGVTIDSFQVSGKNPDSSDKFIVVDNIGSNSSRQSFKILVGTGSSKQDFVGALSTMISVLCACSFEWFMSDLCVKNEAYTVCRALVPWSGLSQIFA